MLASKLTAALFLCIAMTTKISALAQEASGDLAAKLANPVAALISVPFQNNLDFGGGRGNALRYTLNVQPVLPFSISPDWNLIS